jgi:glycosyltransferase involved in cell wall biosynthesis
MPAPRAVDVLIVSLGSTEGLRTADEELEDSLRRAGANVALARPFPPTAIRTMMLTDLVWARAARAAAAHMLRQLQRSPPRAIVYSSTTAALLWPRPGAIRFDAPAASNRPGCHGLWQRPLERRRLRQAPLLLPWSEGGLREAPASAARGERAIVLPVPVEPSGPPEPTRDIAAITYAANPAKKGLDRVLAAWNSVRGELAVGKLGAGADEGAGTRAGAGAGASATAASAELVVAGASADELRLAGFDLEGEEGVSVVGVLSAERYRELTRRARVFVCAPRREDYGIAQLEALADGCLLVTTPAPGPYAVLPIARELDPRLVGDDLGSALRVAIEQPMPDYAQRALQALAPFSRAATDRLVAEEVLPRLLG